MRPIKKIAVLGAGVMGAQIAAHMANAGYDVVLFDLPDDEEGSKLATSAIARLHSQKPLPLALPELSKAIKPANYRDDLPELKTCDVVIEAIAEKIELKADLYHKIANYLDEETITATNTSGLSVSSLSRYLPRNLQKNFCGIHFFNPPRYMPLVEISPCEESDESILDDVEAWLTSHLGKAIVRAKDTPNFIANRVGVFSLLAAMNHTAKLNLRLDEVDSLTGKLIGRPNSATYRTCDIVGLDIMAYVVGTAKSYVDDPWNENPHVPSWMKGLIAKGSLGQKSGVGVYRKQDKTIEVFDPTTQDYVRSDARPDDKIVELINQKGIADSLLSLRKLKHPHAEFLWSIFRDVFHYAAWHCNEIASSVRDIDRAIRYGYGWKEGPFETWQRAGWKDIAGAISEDISDGLTMCDVPLPDWVGHVDAVHTNKGSWSVYKNEYLPYSTLPVYKRQLLPDRMYGEQAISIQDAGKIVSDNGDVVLWSYKSHEYILIASIQTRMHAIGQLVLEGLIEAVERAEKEYLALVIWHDAPFSVGANAKEFAKDVRAGNFTKIEKTIRTFHTCSRTLKHSLVPVVAAVQGWALGGGCEVQMHCAKKVVAFESNIGLVEAKIGLIPGGGGCKEFALKVAEHASRFRTENLQIYLEPVYDNLAWGKSAANALEARQMGFITDNDHVIFHNAELLHTAIHQAYALIQANYVPPLEKQLFRVAGKDFIDHCRKKLHDSLDKKKISEHDLRVATSVARALAGGEVEANTEVDASHIFAIELQEFMDLLHTKCTLERIEYLLKTGKALRN